MRTAILILGVISTILALTITYFIWSMVLLVGQGSDFWTVGIVQLDMVLWLISIVCWTNLVLKTRRR